MLYEQGIRQRKSGKYLYFQYRGGGGWRMFFVGLVNITYDKRYGILIVRCNIR